jgi:hypothetical protein
MALPRPKDQDVVSLPLRRAAAARVADAGDRAHPSPARALQDSLVPDALSADAMEIDGKWHPAATLGFVVVTCGGFWAVLAMTVTHLLILR